MTTITLPHTRSDSKFIIKTALEETTGIKTYQDKGNQIIGKTGAKLRLFASSYGEKVIININDNQASNKETIISVTGMREVSTNIGSNPEEYVLSFIQTLNSIKNYSIGDIEDVLQRNEIDQQSKEVTSARDQASGSWLMTVMMVFVFVIITIAFLGI